MLARALPTALRDSVGRGPCRARRGSGDYASTATAAAAASAAGGGDGGTVAARRRRWQQLRPQPVDRTIEGVAALAGHRQVARAERAEPLVELSSRPRGEDQLVCPLCRTRHDVEAEGVLAGSRVLGVAHRGREQRDDGAWRAATAATTRLAVKAPQQWRAAGIYNVGASGLENEVALAPVFAQHAVVLLPVQWAGAHQGARRRHRLG